MRKTIFLMNIYIYLLFIFNLFVYANEYNVYKQEMLHVFLIGDDKGRIKIDMNSIESGPSAFTFDFNNNLYISDILQRKVLKFDNNFNFISEFYNGYSTFAKNLRVNEKGEFLIYNYDVFAVDTPNLEKNFIINLWKTEYKNLVKQNSYLYADNIVFFYLKDDKIFIIENPNNEVNITNIQDAKIFLEKNQKQSLNNKNEIKIDSDNRILINNILINTDYKSFINYYRKKQISSDSSSSISKDRIQLSIDITKLQNTTYLGKDKDDNMYWKIASSYIYTFNKYGNLLDVFKYDKSKSRCLPAIHPSGDVYFLDYDEKGVYLYRVKRVW